jgi:hypothetical protein
LQAECPWNVGPIDEGMKIMNPIAKPVKKSKKAEPTKKLERKNQLISVRSLKMNW